MVCLRGLNVWTAGAVGERFRDTACSPRRRSADPETSPNARSQKCSTAPALRERRPREPRWKTSTISQA